MDLFYCIFTKLGITFLSFLQSHYEKIQLTTIEVEK